MTLTERKPRKSKLTPVASAFAIKVSEQMALKVRSEQRRALADLLRGYHADVKVYPDCDPLFNCYSDNARGSIYMAMRAEIIDPSNEVWDFNRKHKEYNALCAWVSSWRKYKKALPAPPLLSAERV